MAEYRRTSANFKHKLPDIIILLITARMSRCVSRSDIIAFGQRNLSRFRRMGLFPKGIPSEPTLCRVENTLDDNGLAERMAEFVERHLGKPDEMQIVAVDGKCTRGTVQENGRCPDIVSAYSVSDKVTLRTEICEEKSNEITATAALLDKMDLTNRVVTADAMSCQKTIVDKIIDKGGHFLIEVKANQKTLRWGLEDMVESAEPLDCHSEEGVLAHGRIESRICRTYDGADMVADKEKWGTALTVVDIRTRSVKKSNGSVAEERRLYITDLKKDAKLLNDITRQHWMIESMHWSLDTGMRQDAIKRHTKRGARNLDTIQRMALAIMSFWRSKRKRLRDRAAGYSEIMRNCSLNFAHLLNVIALK